MFNICIVGKYLPIQGGVSRLVYTTSHELAHLGYNVHVITNANEVENSYRLVLDSGDENHELFLEKKGSLTVHNLDSMDQGYFTHIPKSASFETRLYGKGIEVFEQQQFDLIIGWYMQPYGFVASLLAQKFNCSLMLIHAGSDIGRLIKHPQLKRSYQSAYEAAHFVCSTKEGPVRKILKDHGVKDEQLLDLQSGRLTPKYFSGNHTPIDLKKQIDKGSEWLKTLDIHANIKDSMISMNSKNLNENVLTLGIYGKVGTAKGSYELLKVLSQLTKEGIDFNFCTIPLGDRLAQETYFNELLKSKELSERSFVIAPMAYWKIPEYIASCDIVFFLENDFDIEFHTPQIPVEVLASESCLVCSKDIADKIFIKDFLIDTVNYFEIEDPKDITTFHVKLKSLLQDKQVIENIAKRGKQTYDCIDEKYDNKSSIVNTIEMGINKMNKKENKVISYVEIMNYKNDYVVDCFLRDYNMPREEAEEIFKETLKWLYLCGLQSQNQEEKIQELGIFGGTIIIDKMLHTFILCTKDYHEFCDKYIGHYVHHAPTPKAVEDKFEEDFAKNPELTEQKQLTQFRAMMDYVYTTLGKQTAIKWYGTYLEKYGKKQIAEMRMD